MTCGRLGVMESGMNTWMKEHARQYPSSQNATPVQVRQPPIPKPDLESIVREGLTKIKETYGRIAHS